ncbi:MAG: hypothetical protein M3P89_03390 [Actinomycetota bacterium]|nr:hypothetical protein [Actinomycetota bacterium]
MGLRGALRSWAAAAVPPPAALAARLEAADALLAPLLDAFLREWRQQSWTEIRFADRVLGRALADVGDDVLRAAALVGSSAGLHHP